MKGENVEQDPKTKQEQSAIYQFLATFVLHLLTLVYGINTGWSSPSILILTSNDSPLPTGRISEEESSWIASLSYIGGFFGNIIFGFITNRFGRKIPSLFVAILIIAGWFIILFAENVYYLYAARVLNGIVGGAVFVMAPLFTSEIANDSVRGILGSMLVFAVNLGILIAYVLANYFDYYMIPKVGIALALVYIITFMFFPESPSFLVKQNKFTEAEKSLRFYKNLRDTDKDHLTNGINKIKKVLDSSNDKSFSWSELWQNPGRKAFMIGSGLALLVPSCGIIGLLCYTANIFDDAGSTMPPNTAGAFVAAIQFFGSIITSNLVDKAGRKFLYAVSSIATTLGYVVLGVYMLLKSMEYDVEAQNWIPIASFAFILLAGALGILSLAFVVISEIMPENLKNFGASFCLSLIWFFIFIVAKFIPTLHDVLGFHGSMFLFAGVCSVSTILILLFLPETKGKSYHQIMEMLS